MAGEDILKLVGSTVKEVHAHSGLGCCKGFTIETEDGILVDVWPYAINENVAMVGIRQNGSECNHSRT